METIHSIFASFDFFGVLAKSLLHTFINSFTLGFIPFFDKAKVYFLDHHALITGVFGFILLFSLFSAVQYLAGKKAVALIKK